MSSTVLICFSRPGSTRKLDTNVWNTVLTARLYITHMMKNTLIDRTEFVVEVCRGNVRKRGTVHTVLRERDVLKDPGVEDVIVQCNSFGTRPKKMRISQRLFIRF